MTLEAPINVRLSAKQQRQYEAEASRLNMPLASYLRERLEANENIFEEIASLRRPVDRAATTLENNSDNEAIILEILFLLRQMVQPEKMRIAHNELTRLGYNVWRGKENNNKL